MYDRLWNPLKDTGKNIIVDSFQIEGYKVFEPGTIVRVSNDYDLFDDRVKSSEIKKVIEVVTKAKDVTFQFITKNPARYLEFGTYPKNVWVGLTAENHKDALLTRKLIMVDVKTRFIEFPNLNSSIYPSLNRIHWVSIIGGEHTKTYQVAAIVREANTHNVPVWMSDGITDAYGKTHKEYPKR